MNVKIRDFRGVVRADIDLERICLVAGLNEAGKSSIAQGIGAVLAGMPLPVTGIKKGSAGALVRTGAAKGGVQISSGDGTATITWPACELTSSGVPPRASPYAAGILSLPDLGDREKAIVLIEYLKADPTRDDLATVLKDAGLSDAGIEKVWQATQAEGWDASHARAKDTGQRLKGKWEQVAGEHYGSSKAETWQPEGWEADLAATSEDTLELAATTAKEFLEAGIAASAVDAHEREALQAKADRVTELAEIAGAATVAHQNAQGALVMAQTALAKLPKPAEPGEKPIEYKCPHCAGALHVVDGKPIAASAVNYDAALNGRSREAIATAKATILRLEGPAREAAERKAAADRDLYDAGRAAETLRTTLPSYIVAGQSVDQARESVAAAERRLTAFQAHREALKHHTSVGLNQSVIDALAPDGVRKAKLSGCLREFNARLASLGTAAGWQPVTVDPDLSIAYGGRPYALNSESAQWRARAMLALAMAELDGSDVVILDRADMLVAGERNRLFRLLGSLPDDRDFLVCMSMNRREDVPDIEAKGLGQAYWIEAGIAERIVTGRTAA